MCIRRGVYDDRRSLLARLVNPVDDLTFMVRLAKVYIQARRLSNLPATRSRVFKRIRAVYLRLAFAQEV
jgi:hypothetical protein